MLNFHKKIKKKIPKNFQKKPQKNPKIFQKKIKNYQKIPLDFESIQFLTSHLEAKNPFGLVFSGSQKPHY